MPAGRCSRRPSTRTRPPTLIGHLSSTESNLEWAKFVGVIPIHQGAEQDPAFTGEQFAGWFTEMNDERWKPTVMPTYLEEFAYFADVMVVQGGQELLLGERTAEDVANEWAAYLTDAQKKWMARPIGGHRPPGRSRGRRSGSPAKRGVGPPSFRRCWSPISI